MSLPDVFDKIVGHQRGGYCFEQNTLLAAALQALGFKILSSLARARWNRPPEVISPQTHLILICTVDDGASYLVDVAYGGLQCLSPLRIDTDSTQHTPSGDFRITPVGNGELKKQW